MKVSSLTQFVDQKNSFAGIFGQPQLSLQNSKDRQRIADALDSALSPENLSCDGEVRGAALKRKYNFLMDAAIELQHLDPSVKMYELYTGE